MKIPIHEPMDYRPPVYTGYRIGMLRKVYEILARYGNMPRQDEFIDDCMGCPEISQLLDNSVVQHLDSVGGLPKLVLSIYSKYIQHSV